MFSKMSFVGAWAWAKDMPMKVPKLISSKCVIVELIFMIPALCVAADIRVVVFHFQKEMFPDCGRDPRQRNSSLPFPVPNDL